MTTLLISGSRSIRARSHADMEWYHRLIERVVTNNWRLVVGDAQGVDADILYALSANDFKHLGVFATVCGIQPRPRNIGIVNANLPSVARYLHMHECKSYTERDDAMLAVADYVYCIWDGKSKGTKRVYDKALELNKTAWLRMVN